MRKAKSVAVIILLTIMGGCGEGSKQSNDELIIVDVTANYPRKELILQDFMDVEYVTLETSDEFITQGVVKAIGKEIILVTNWRQDGDIFIFDRSTGKGLRKINRLGQGPEEYTQYTEIILDEDNHEMFIIALAARNILVYDLYGNFKRSFKFTDTGYYSDVFNYDGDNLICYKHFFTETGQPSYLIISKEDGSITREIQIPFKEIKRPILTKEIDGQIATISFPFTQISLYHDNFVLVEASSDTVYNYLPDGTISPLIARTPSIHAMDTEILLCPTILTDRYYFMQTTTKELSERMTFPYNNLVYDKQENTILEYSIYNDDFTNKKWVEFNKSPVNQEIATWQSLEAHQLVEAHEKGQLKGKLNEIAAGLDEDSNPVIMLIKHKK